MKHKWKLDEDGKIDEWAWESGFHNGVYCKCCGKRVCVHCDSDWELMDDCPGDTRKPKTNADRIRAMTDEKLCEFLSQYKFCDICEEGCSDCTYHGDCDKRLLDWLQQPAEGDA